MAKKFEVQRGGRVYLVLTNPWKPWFLRDGAQGFSFWSSCL